MSTNPVCPQGRLLLPMSDFEYLHVSEEELPFSHLTCCLCQSLAVLPVRLLHIDAIEDCGTVTCLECFRRWARSSKDERVVSCPRCRRDCPHPTDQMAVPDRLLGRMVGHMKARCTFCKAVYTVEDMFAHSRMCPLRRLYHLRRTHHPGSPECGDYEECAQGIGCQWGDIIALNLWPVIPSEVELYVREWIQSTIATGDSYVYRSCFRQLLHLAPRLVLDAWAWSWSQTTPRCGPNVREMCRMFELLPFPEKDHISNRLQVVIQAAIEFCTADMDHHRQVMATVPQEASVFVLSALSKET